MKVYNFLKNKPLEEINDYIEMLDKKGDKDSLKQALRARAEVKSKQQKGKKFVQDSYKEMVAKKKEKDREIEYVNDKDVIDWSRRKPQSKEPDNDKDKRISNLKQKALYEYQKSLAEKKNKDSWEKGVDFVKSNYKKMVQMKKDRDVEKSKEMMDSASQDFKKAEATIQERKRQPQSEDEGLRQEVMSRANEAFPEPERDPNIKKAEPPPEPESLMKYTEGRLDTGKGIPKYDDDKEPTEEEVKDFIRKSRKRVGN